MIESLHFTLLDTENDYESLRVTQKAVLQQPCVNLVPTLKMDFSKRPKNFRKKIFPYG